MNNIFSNFELDRTVKSRATGPDGIGGITLFLFPKVLLTSPYKITVSASPKGCSCPPAIMSKIPSPSTSITSTE